MSTLRILISLLALFGLAACVSGGQVQMQKPLTARPPPHILPPKAADGAIFNVAGGYRPLFEDRRARYVGDTIVININENLRAAQQSKSSADRSASASLSIPVIKGLPGKALQGAGISGESAMNFEGKGEASSLNTFSGTITATVIDVLANGNLVVAGDKQIGIGHNSEFIRFSGTVTPAAIQIGNAVSSTQVADVRLEYIGRGYIDSAQAMPWLQRFFLSVLPF